MLIYTILLIYGTIDLNKEYVRSGLQHIDNKLSFYFLPAEFVSRVPDPILGIYTLLMLFFIIPILLTLIGASSFYDDYQANIINQLVAKKGLGSYLIDKLLVSFLSSFILVLISIVFQTVFTALLVRIINNNLIHYTDPTFSEISATIVSAVKISLFYACIIVLSGAISFFFSKIKYLSYFLPLVISTLMTFSFPRIPLGLAFIYSGYKNKSQMLLIIVLMALVALTIIITSIYIRSARKRLL
jgi:hypothetical protein